MKSKLISGTHHIALKTQGEVEFRQAVDFYAGLLGLQEIRSWQNGNDCGVMLSTGNSIIEITSNGKAAASQGSIRHFRFSDSRRGCLYSVGSGSRLPNCDGAKRCSDCF